MGEGRAVDVAFLFSDIVFFGREGVDGELLSRLPFEEINLS